MKKTHINFPIEVTEIIGFLTGMIEFQETGIDILAGEAGAVTGEAEAGTGGVEVETGGVEVGNVVAVIDHLAGIVRGRQKKKKGDYGFVFVFSRYVSSFFILLLLFSWVFHIYGFGFCISWVFSGLLL